MQVPDPSLAREVAAALDGLAGATAEAAGELRSLTAQLAQHWQGHAATTAGQLLTGLATTSGQAGDALHTAGHTWSQLAADLHEVQVKVRVVDDLLNAAAAVGLVSLLQGGLDVASDAAAAAEATAARGALATARQLLRVVVERAVARAGADRSALALLTAVALRVGRGLVEAAALTTGLEELEYGHVHAADVLSPATAAGLVPPALQPQLWAEWFDPAIRRPVPTCFPTRAAFDTATDAADSWAAEDTDGALVRLDASPTGGVRLTVTGGGVAAALAVTSSHPPGRPLTAVEVEADAPSLAALLDQLAVYAPGTPTVVVS